MIIKNGKRIDGCSDTLPIGTVQPFLGLTPPKGYLLCQGQAVSKITYKELYEICGDTFGTSTETEFYLPDLRGKTIAGYNENDAAMNTIGKLLGEITHKHSTGNHTLTESEMPYHTHSLPSSDQYGKNFTPSNEYIIDSRSMMRIGQDNLVPMGVSLTESAGSSQPHHHGDTGEASNYQPTIVMNWIVKAVMTIPVQSSLATSYTDSTTDVYTCDYVNEAIRTGLGDNVPAGTVVDYNGEEIPEGWELAEDYASVYIGSNEPTEGQEVWIQKGKNLFDKSNVAIGWLNADGSINYETTYRTSSFIKVSPNTTYYKTETGSARGKFYDINKRPLTEVYDDIANGEGAMAFTTPGNAHYLRITLIVDYLDTLQIEFGNKRTDYEPYINKKFYLKNEINEYEPYIKNRTHIGVYQPEDGEEVWIQKGKNLCYKNYIRVAGGGMAGSYPVYIGGLKPSTTYTLSFVKERIDGTTISNDALYPWHLIDFYGANTGRLAQLSCPSSEVSNGFSSGNRSYSTTFTTPQNASYLIVYFDNNNGDTNINTLVKNIQLEEGPETTSYEKYVEPMVRVKSDNGGYEEFIGFETGKWTPEVQVQNYDAAAQPTVEYTRQSGSYTRIGKMVFVEFSMRGKITALNDTNNYACIGTLPYVPACDVIFGQNAVTPGCVYGLISSNAYDNLTFALSAGSNKMRLQCNSGSSASVLIVTTASYFDVGGSGWYRID